MCHFCEKKMVEAFFKVRLKNGSGTLIAFLVALCKGPLKIAFFAIFSDAL
jgi:hypothetical protein